MHMADALLSPTTALVMWTLSAAALGLASRRVRASTDDRLVPLMGMLGAFVFAAQMINFSIPGSGSSGHLGGGLLLALLLGPYPALIVISSVLTVQALFECAPMSPDLRDAWLDEIIACLRHDREREADCWLREAVRLRHGSVGLRELALQDRPWRPHAWLDWLRHPPSP